MVENFSQILQNQSQNLIFDKDIVVLINRNSSYPVGTTLHSVDNTPYTFDKLFAFIKAEFGNGVESVEMGLNKQDNFYITLKDKDGKKMTSDFRNITEDGLKKLDRYQLFCQNAPVEAKERYPSQVSIYEEIFYDPKFSTQIETNFGEKQENLNKQIRKNK